jgi:hypothetical protein
MEKKSNIQLIYDYTKSLVSDQSNSLNRLDTKLSAFLGFSALLLRFALNLPDDAANNVCQVVVKVLVCVFAGASVLFSAMGLTAKTRGTTVDPKVLMGDDWYWEPEERCKAFIVNTWIVATDEYEAVGKKKGQKLNLTIWLFCIATILFAVDIGASSFWSSE